MGCPMRVLNLGAGVQSTAVFLMAHNGIIPHIEHAIFADTQEEPKAVYDHLAWLRTIPSPVPIIHVATIGKLGDHLLAGIDSAGQRKKHKPGLDGSKRFVSIPAFTSPHHDLPRSACQFGMTRRRCTKEYKIRVVEKTIRHAILGLEPRQRAPKGTRIVQIFGISWDERRRAERISKRFDSVPWSTPEFPLVDKRMTRQDCLEFLNGLVPHQTPRSACVFCPYRRASEWLEIKASPEDWSRAIEIDRGLRTNVAVNNCALRHSLYLHRSCIPLEMVDLESEAAKEKARKSGGPDMFSLMDCGEGMCGV